MRLCVRLVRGLTLSCLVLCGILIGAGAINVAASGVAFAQTASSIAVQGNRRVEADTVRSYFRPGPGGRLGPVEIDEGLKSLYATGLFADVHVNHAGGRLVVTVIENPVINRVAFEGNKKAKDEQLRIEVQSKARGTLSKPTVQADVQRIIEIYHRSGRFDVQVTPKIIELPNNRVDLVFEIKEGDKTGVKEINFVGNKAFSRSRLKDVIKTTESNWLSFLQTTDIYDPDRVEADRDLLRRFYLKYGYADVRIVSAVGEYDPAKKGFIVTFTIDEGPQYKVGTVDVVSNVQAINPAQLRGRLKISAGSVYNADLVEKSVEAMTIEAAKQGFAFANVRPRGDRNATNHTINLSFLVEEGARAYIERINIRGNTRTRDYVIRREFDLGEGDAYNRALIDRAERRLKNLNFFKTVRITNEPGSAPDRVVVNVDVEEMPTGEFSVSGGYSTADGFIGEVSVADRNLMGRGQLAKATVTYGERTRGFDLSFVEPYLLGYRMAGGIDLYARQNLASSYVSYDSQTIGTNLRLGFALTEEIAFQPRYSIYQQKITLPNEYNDCSPTTVPGNPQYTGPNCYSNGEASLPVRMELANGPVTTSLVGYTLSYNTVDNLKSPTSGLYAELRQDFAGVGGDVNFIRSQVEARNYYEVLPDVVGVLKLQGGHIAGWGGKDLRMLDHFKMGPNLVRGFAPAGIGPRDLNPNTTQDALGGSLYWGASVEAQTPLYFLPKEIGIKLAAFVDAGSVWDYKGPTYWAQTGETVQLADSNAVRSSAGIGFLWDSPLGPLRFDLAYPLSKESYDRTQVFRFSGGGKF
ncbi:outer membrane protein assembly factor BamA [Pseudolabrys taiwanensis]|uniref:Outer membrane protein assembly factor BamA n=1 Tax=Pseudolabrys taiwanensis TaxID=331696 RepID=A0A345ZSE3_9HYPH|nr:outer membrane protein assembly factor BamA [Pseudolabrys taiwanensis]AXK79840.1 outer membrane protein assembly factor BamA [Pseudolabrys taiwanensis]